MPGRKGKAIPLHHQLAYSPWSVTGPAGEARRLQSLRHSRSFMFKVVLFLHHVGLPSPVIDSVLCPRKYSMPFVNSPAHLFPRWRHRHPILPCSWFHLFCVCVTFPVINPLVWRKAPIARAPGSGAYTESSLHFSGAPPEFWFLLVCLVIKHDYSAGS